VKHKHKILIQKIGEQMLLVTTKLLQVCELYGVVATADIASNNYNE